MKNSNLKPARLDTETRTVRGACIFTALSLGFFSSTCQIILLREVLNFGKGNELTIATALFFWLAGVGGGAWLFAFLQPRRNPRAWVCLLGLLTIIFSFACCAVARIFGFFVSEPGTVTGIGDLILCCAASMSLPGLFMGALFPLIVLASEGSVSGSRLYLLEAAGSAAGGLVFTFILAGRVQHFTVLAWAALPMIAALTILAGRRRLAAGRRTALWAAAAALAAAGLILASPVDRGAHALRWKAITGNLRLLRTVETKHQRLDLAYDPPQYSIFSDGTYDFAFPDPYGAGTMAEVVLLEHPAPRKMLMIGGSPVDVAARAKAHGLDRVDYVQIDPMIMNLVTGSTPKLMGRLFCGSCIGRFLPEDGKRAVRLGTTESYDIVWASLPDPMTLLVNRYYTIETYRQVRRILRPGGIFVSGFNLDYSSPQKASKKYSASVLRTIERVFEKTILGFGSGVIVLADDGKGAVTDDPEELSGRASRRGLDPLLHPPEMFENIFNDARSRWLRGILGREQVLINTDMHPISYRLQLQYFVHLVESDIASGREGALETLLKKSWQIPWWAALLPALLFPLVLIPSKRKSFAASASVVYAMALTGGTGMLLQLVLLLSYQTFSGIMYEGIGLLYAAFMIGLALGTASAEKLGRAGALLSEAAVILDAGATVVILPSAQEAVALIPLLVVTAGLATGFAFPILYNAHRKIRAAREKEGLVTSAGLIDGSDHAGAALGALLCALVLIPSFGLLSTLVLAIAYKASSMLLLVVTRVERR